MSFKEWISYFEGVDRPIGDLAHAFSEFSNLPSGNEKELIKEHLALNTDVLLASSALEAFDHAWEFYLKDTSP